MRYGASLRRAAVSCRRAPSSEPPSLARRSYSCYLVACSFRLIGCPVSGIQENFMDQKIAASHKLEAIHPSPEEAHKMPYAPAIRIVGACDLMFISGATPSKLYHDHPHRD